MIKVTEFDGVISGNTHPIHLVMHEIKLSSPADSKVNWEFPGYVSIVLSNGKEIAFGESLEADSGYSWNCYEIDGTNNVIGSFDDLKDIKEIANELWRQISPLTKGEAK